MTTITLNVPDSMTVRGGGVETTLDMTRVPEASLVAIFNYGLGRIVQDNVNARVKALRDERGLAKGTAVPEAKTFLEERVKDVYDGTLDVRKNAGMSDVEKVALALAKAELARVIESAKGKDAAKAFRQADAAETNSKVAAFMAANADRDWTAEARAEIARRQEEARIKAESIAKALSAVAKAKMDLDAILNA